MKQNSIKYEYMTLQDKQQNGNNLDLKNELKSPKETPPMAKRGLGLCNSLSKLKDQLNSNNKKGYKYD